ncbi:hypothetical protein COJ85_14825 [Bacillus sp. AFS076308]|nr:hypothetical protein COJ85_14825 [Bacillus sp. AFS076308]PGV50037.1 hypothetical protein COD92_19425 [Bacillus sp. AFS037270]
MSHIQGKILIITGASSGIGKATAKELASKGAKFVLAKLLKSEDYSNGLCEIWKYRIRCISPYPWLYEFW